MSKWTIIRITLIAATFLASCFSSQVPAQSEDMPAPMLIAIFVFEVVGMIFIIGMQRINPWSAKFWRYPDWSINPFQVREPLQFFHFGGYFMLASGAGAIFNQIYNGQVWHITGYMPLAFGAGI